MTAGELLKQQEALMNRPCTLLQQNRMSKALVITYQADPIPMVNQRGKVYNERRWALWVPGGTTQSGIIEGIITPV